MELKHCPFCGGEVVPFHAKSDELQIDFGYRFFCKNNCCMQVKFYPTKELAAQDWNKRVSQVNLRVPSEEEWMERFCTPKQFEGYKNRKEMKNGEC